MSMCVYLNCTVCGNMEIRCLCVCVLELYCMWKYGVKISVCVYLNCTVCGNMEIRCLRVCT